MSSGAISEPMPERSWRCSTLFHQRSIWLRTMAGSSTNSAHLGSSLSRWLSAPATAAEKLPAGKDADPAGGSRSRRPSLRLRLRLTLPAQPRVDRGQQPLGDRRLCQRQQLRLVQARLRALRLGIELADGLDLVAEELNAHRAVGLGRVDIENAAAPRELARHLDQVHLRVTHAGQMRR